MKIKTNNIYCQLYQLELMKICNYAVQFYDMQKRIALYIFCKKNMPEMCKKNMLKKPELGLL
jgi:hypothetical protein